MKILQKIKRAICLIDSVWYMADQMSWESSVNKISLIKYLKINNYKKYEYF